MKALRIVYGRQGAFAFDRSGARHDYKVAELITRSTRRHLAKDECFIRVFAADVGRLSPQEARFRLESAPPECVHACAFDTTDSRSFPSPSARVRTVRFPSRSVLPASRFPIGAIELPQSDWPVKLFYARDVIDYSSERVRMED